MVGRGFFKRVVDYVFPTLRGGYIKRKEVYPWIFGDKIVYYCGVLHGDVKGGIHMESKYWIHLCDR